MKKFLTDFSIKVLKHVKYHIIGSSVLLIQFLAAYSDDTHFGCEMRQNKIHKILKVMK